jgi:hypothetical protein
MLRYRSALRKAAAPLAASGESRQESIVSKSEYSPKMQRKIEIVSNKFEFVSF